ncbi:hypothetical protein [Streptomyces sp. G44]|uniref:hypothetical protein n=1 Tax=Streptomyces sp. G44 TaxID=2807632 RepID=UPI0027DD0E8E|nr:hypothetical protein [Streptomyces sp. G44]
MATDLRSAWQLTDDLDAFHARAEEPVPGLLPVPVPVPVRPGVFGVLFCVLRRIG